MSNYTLEFEAPLREIEDKIDSMKSTGIKTGMDVREAVQKLEEQLTNATKEFLSDSSKNEISKDDVPSNYTTFYNSYSKTEQVIDKKIKFKSFLKGKIVDLVIIDEEFINNTDWFSWINQKVNTEYLTQGNFPNTLSHQKKYFKEQILSNKRLQLGVVLKLNEELIGVISLYSINYLNFQRTQ